MKKYNIKIRNANIKDTEILIEIGARTFFEAYINRKNKAGIESYIKKYLSSKNISEELKSPSNIFLIALSDNMPIGYAKLRKNGIPGGLGKKSIEIERMYLIKEKIGKGIGKIVMKKCLDIARKKGYKIVWLGVWEQHINAIGFYKRFEFKKFGEQKFKFGNKLHKDILLKKEI